MLDLGGWDVVQGLEDQVHAVGCVCCYGVLQLNIL
jgi:hypothetical protein